MNWESVNTFKFQLEDSHAEDDWNARSAQGQATDVFEYLGLTPD